VSLLQLNTFLDEVGEMCRLSCVSVAAEHVLDEVGEVCRLSHVSVAAEHVLDEVGEVCRLSLRSLQIVNISRQPFSMLQVGKVMLDKYKIRC
jgi:hypothetical protein